MEFENQIMRMIFIHCENNKVKMDSNAAWELAKKITSITKLKSKKELTLNNNYAK